MNKCYLIGKVIGEPIFNFFFMEDNISICYFWINLENCNIKIFALNDLADCVYQNVQAGQILLVEGCLDSYENKELSINMSNFQIIN